VNPGQAGLLERGTLLPAQPVLELVRGSAREIAQACGVSQRQVVRWRAGSPMYAGTADRVADRLGRHPANIWSGW
jgi:hypothetical protein